MPDILAGRTIEEYMKYNPGDAVLIEKLAAYVHSLMRHSPYDSKPNDEKMVYRRCALEIMEIISNCRR